MDYREDKHQFLMCWRSVFGSSNAQVLLCFPTVHWLRIKWLEFIHTSIIESNVSSALGFASMVPSSMTRSLWGKLNAIGYLERGRSHSICPAFASCFSGNYVHASNKADRSKALQWAFNAQGLCNIHYRAFQVGRFLSNWPNITDLWSNSPDSIRWWTHTLKSNALQYCVTPLKSN